MRSILIKDADYLVTSNESGQILRRASLLIEDNIIASINPKVKRADRVINARGKIVLPGLINMHH
ncbi:MAG: 8-oxoguanine deaminase, partial [Candidatus Portnoybacteria bacterium CG02_land_8_20_14_3_00_45_8]